MKKAIIVSPVEYFEFFQQAFSDWDAQHPVTSVDQMWNDLADSKLDDESEIVVLNDIFYDDNNEQLELAILTLAADALVLVVADLEFKEKIQQRISSIAVRRNILSVAKFWFISRDNPINEINDAIVEYESYVPKREQEKIREEQEAMQRNARVQKPDTVHAANDGFDATDTSEYLQQVEAQNNGGRNVQQQQYERPAPVTPVERPAPQQKAQQRPQQQPSQGSNRSQQPRKHPVDDYNGIERNGMVIASTSSKGGSGKSTVGLCTASMIFHASRLAYEAGESDRPLDVVIVDMDTRDGQIGFLIGESTPTVLNIITSQDFSRNNIRQNIVYNERLGISALLAPKRARTADYATPDFYRDVISKLRTMFDIVILDTSVNYVDELIYDVVLPMSDAVLFVTDMSRGAVFGMTRWISEVTLPIEDGGSAAISKDKIGIVVNKSMGNVGFDQGQLVEAASQVPLIASIPMDSAAVLASTNNNRLDDIVLKHPVISPAYFALASQIIQNSVPLVQPTPFDPDNPTGKSSQPPLPPKKRKKLFSK